MSFDVYVFSTTSKINSNLRFGSLEVSKTISRIDSIHIDGAQPFSDWPKFFQFKYPHMLWAPSARNACVCFCFVLLAFACFACSKIRVDLFVRMLLRRWDLIHVKEREFCCRLHQLGARIVELWWFHLCLRIVVPISYCVFNAVLLFGKPTDQFTG